MLGASAAVAMAQEASTLGLPPAPEAQRQAEQRTAGPSSLATPKQVPAAESSAADAPRWNVDAGGLALASPRFPGARDTRYLVFPAVEAHYGDRIFASIREGVGFVAWRRGALTVGPVANVAFPRREGQQYAALKGLGDVPLTVEAGAFARLALGPYASASLEVRQGLNGHRGLLAETALSVGAPPLLDYHLFFSGGPSLTYYNGQYSGTYYGVTPAQSAGSGYATFDPASGWRLGFGGSAVYRLGGPWTLVGFTNFGYLLGPITDAPLVRGPYGSTRQWTNGLVLAYRFHP